MKIHYLIEPGDFMDPEPAQAQCIVKLGKRDPIKFEIGSFKVVSEVEATRFSSAVLAFRTADGVGLNLKLSDIAPIQPEPLKARCLRTATMGGAR